MGVLFCIFQCTKLLRAQEKTYGHGGGFQKNSDRGDHDPKHPEPHLTILNGTALTIHQGIKLKVHKGTYLYQNIKSFHTMNNLN